MAENAQHDIPRTVVDTVRLIHQTWPGWSPKETNISVKTAIEFASADASDKTRWVPMGTVDFHKIVNFGKFPAKVTNATAIYNSVRSTHLFHDIGMAVPTVLTELGYAPITAEHPLRLNIDGLPNDKKNLTGVADLVCTDVASSTKLYIVDVKTVEQLYTWPLFKLVAKVDHFLQVALYGRMLELMARNRDYDLHVDGFAIVGIDPFQGRAQAFTAPVADYAILHNTFDNRRKPLWDLLHLQ